MNEIHLQVEALIAPGIRKIVMGSRRFSSPDDIFREAVRIHGVLEQPVIFDVERSHVYIREGDRWVNINPNLRPRSDP